MKHLSLPFSIINKYNNKIPKNQMKNPTCSLHTSNNKSALKMKQELIVEINIGRKNNEIRIVDINNVNLIDQEIKWFIRLHNLKDSAFYYIKDIIQKEIYNRREEMYRESHRKHSCNCKCSNKVQQFQLKEKIMTEVLSFNQSPSSSSPIRQSLSPIKNSIQPIIRQSLSPINHNHSPIKINISSSKQPQSKKKPFHLQIKIHPKSQNDLKMKESKQFKLYEMTNNESFFNSKISFPSLGEIQKVNFADDTFSDAFGSNRDKDSCQFTNLTEYQSKQKSPIKCNEGMIRSQHKDSIVKPLETSFKKNINFIQLKNTPAKRQSLSPDKQSLLSNRKLRLSTKQRKMAIMTPRQKINDENSQFQMPVYHGIDHENLQKFINEQKKSLREYNNHSFIKKITDEPLFSQRNISEHYQKVLRELFQKLTSNNPPQVQELHTKYVSYQHLQKQQLHFMGVLFQKINYKELNNLNFNNFRRNSLKYCWRQLYGLIYEKEKRSNKENPHSARYLTEEFTY